MPPAKVKDRRISWGKVKEKMNVTLTIEFEEPSAAEGGQERLIGAAKGEENFAVKRIFMALHA